MNILIIYRYYWPDTTTYARILRSIAERLVRDGHTVTVFTAQPSYNDLKHEKRPWIETVGDVKLIRMPLLWERKSIFITRLLNSGLFLLGSLLYGLFKPKVESVMCHSSPPVFMGAVSRVIARMRKASFVYHMQDLYPEVGLLGGNIKPGPVAAIMKYLETDNCAGADALVVLSGDMANAVRMRGVPDSNLAVLNNFIMERYEEAKPPDTLKKPDGVWQVLFAGNHGVFQGLEYVIDAAHLLKDHPDIQFQFVGEGLAKKTMIERAGNLLNKTVFFHSYVSPEEVFEVMRRADLGLVPLQPGVYRYAYPSKTMMLLAAGLPLLVVVEQDSELAKMIESEKLGWSCPPRDAHAMADAILAARKSKKSRKKRADHLQDVAERLFGRETWLGEWTTLFNALEAKLPIPQHLRPRQPTGKTS
jgi:glycosyltransferase involved in cell wall biosynthesis